MIVDGLEMSQNATVKMDKMGGYQRKDCNDTGFGRFVAECHAVAFCDNREAFIGKSSLCRDEKTRRFHFPVFTFHVMTNRFQVNLMGGALIRHSELIQLQFSIKG